MKAPLVACVSSTQIAFGGTGAMAAKAGGANLTFPAITTGVYLQSVWGNASVQKVSDLAGKSVSATTKGGPSDFALHTVPPIRCRATTSSKTCWTSPTTRR